MVRGLGPLDRDGFGMRLSALAQTLGAERLRWLTGMERQLTEQGNVYNEKVDKRRYEEVLATAAIEEFRKP